MIIHFILDIDFIHGFSVRNTVGYIFSLKVSVEAPRCCFWPGQQPVYCYSC